MPGFEAEDRAPTLGREHQKQYNRDRADGRPQEIPLQAVERGLAPCQQRAEGGQQKEQERDRNRDAIIKRSADRNFVALHEFGNLRKPGSPQHVKREQKKEQVVEQKARLARDERFEFVLTAQILMVQDKEENENRERDGQEPGEPAADRRLRESMNRGDDAAAREECSKDCEPERREHQPHVPDFQHAAFLLHHHGMQKRGADEPGHERRVFDRVPSPVPAPAQHSISPVCSEEDAASQQSPGDHGPAAGDVNPFVAGIPHDQRPEREGKGHGRSDVAEIEHRRMDDHLGILQKRIQAAAVRAQRALQQAERVGGEVHQREKKDLHASQNH